MDNFSDKKASGDRAYKHATIEDVARIADVSTATVSRTLRNPEKVSEATRKKVLAAVARTGYTANVMAINLRRRQSRLIMVLVPNVGQASFSSVLVGLEKVAKKRGYGLLIGNTENDPVNEEIYANFVRSKQADGIILLTGHLPYGVEPDIFRKRQIPAVAVMEPLGSDVVPFFGIDDCKGAYAAVLYLIEHGHKKIVHVRGNKGSVSSEQRELGYRMAMKDSNVSIDEGLIVDGGASIEAGMAAVEQMYIADREPTAFFCCHDEAAIGTILALNARNKDVPGEISVIGFNDIQFSSCTSPPLTTMRLPRRLIGERAMDCIIDMVTDRTIEPASEKFAAELVVRKSVGNVAIN